MSEWFLYYLYPIPLGYLYPGYPLHIFVQFLALIEEVLGQWYAVMLGIFEDESSSLFTVLSPYFRDFCQIIV